MGFLSGIFGSSSKSSSSSTTATTTNQGFSEVAGNALAINGSNNVVTDQGAVADAFDFARAALDSQTSLAGEVMNTSSALYSSYGDKLSGFAAQATADQGDKLAEIVKWLVGGAVVVAGVAFYRKGRA